MGVIEADDLVTLDEVEAITLDFLLSPPPTLMAETRSPVLPRSRQRISQFELM